MVNKKKEKILAYACLCITICFSIVFFVKFLINTSVGADNQRVLIEANLDKYINYEISDQDKGTLVEYNVRTGIEYGDGDYIPLKSSELAISLNQIDGKYPYAVKIITKSTELSNGKTENIEDNYEYDSNTGIIVIRASNQDENGEIINDTKPSDNARDEYVIIAYYDTYAEQEERELAIKVQSTVTLSTDDRQIRQENEFKGIVKDNIGELTSVTSEANEIYNGYIKSNIINGTNYDTEYKETAKIMVSKKEAGQKIEFKESNSFERVYQNSNGEEITEEFSNNGDLVYKSTKIKQQDMKRLLGENGVIEILDGSENLIATIDENTQFAEDGSIVISYENELESIIIKTSNIENEGILAIENTKKIKSTMRNIDYTKIKTSNQIIGINEETVMNDEEETIEEKVVFTNSYENTTDIKESTNNINIDISNTEWTNKNQNEITFNVYISSNSTKDNMLKNPSVKIELPSEVEKVILGEASVVYANGLELQDPYLETSENGNIVIVANLIGTQTEYDGNTLELVTDVKISATIILKKDIENTTGNVNLTYTNYYAVNGKAEIENRSSEIKIASYKEESIREANPLIATYANTSLLTSTTENIEGLTVEVTPVRGDTVLKDGDTVYEGEFIKYNITVTNTSDEKIDNIKVVGTVPEGTTYGELEADYYTSTGKYQYNYDDTITEKTIEIGSLETGKSVTKFYEVQVNDLLEGQDEQEITSNVKVYAEQTQVMDYSMTNVIKKAEVKVFLGAFLGTDKNAWDYTLFVSSDEIDEVTATVKVPNEFNLEYILIDPNYEGGGLKLDLNEIASVEEDGIKVKVETNKRYLIAGYMNCRESEVETEGEELELTAVANVEIGNVTYSSNENRILYGYDSVSILMTSESEGEEVRYGDEINYEIVVTNTGRPNFQDESTSSIGVHVIDFLPEDVEPVKITYNKYTEEKASEEKDTNEQLYSFESTGIYKEETVIEDIGVLTDEEGNRLPNVDLYLTIPYEKSVTIKVETTAGLVFEKTKIENSATVSGILEEDNIQSKTSNTIAHTILPYNYDESEEPDIPDNPDDPSDPDEPSDPSDNIEKYSIAGVAWLDENEDGKRQISEPLLNGITVMLVNTANSSAIQAKEVTDSNGAYRFSELEEGNYIVIFNYDTDIYSVASYQKSGISSSLNSDAIDKEITLMETQIKVGITDTITLNASISNIDIGLIKNKICDLKLDKYISKVQVKTTSGTKEYTYDNTQLAKVEIKAKEIQGATVVVNYKIVVTNEGELPVSSIKVVDSIPDGFNFSSELNKSWTTTNNGEVVNITNQGIKAGESAELTLILTKSMTSNSTGTFTNMAEIGEMSNSLGTSDTDSTPGNKAETEDDFSKADLIISVSTGVMVYISIGILLLALVGIVIFLSYKYGIFKIGKISLFGIVIMVTLVAGNNEVDAGAPESAQFTWTSNSHGYSNIYGSRYFYGNENTGDALCIQAGVGVAGAGSTYSFYGYGGSTAYDEIEDEAPELKFDLTNLNDDGVIEVAEQHPNGIPMKVLGPFKFKCSSSKAEFEIQLYDYNKNKVYCEPHHMINNGIVPEIGTTKFTIQEGYENKEIEFYVYVKPEDYDKKIAYVELKAETSANVKEGVNVYRQAEYTHNSWTQDVRTFRKFLDENKSNVEKKKITNKKSIKWMNFTGNLKIIKKDEETGERLKGVKFSVKGPDKTLNRSYTTDDNGEINLENISVGEYTITESSNPNYGYTVMVEDSIKVKTAQTVEYTAKNQKQTGNLQIIKRDTDSNLPLSDISFKIKNSDGEYIIATDSKDTYTGKEVIGTIGLTNMTTTTNYDEATTFTTNDSGQINILNMLVGDYFLEEMSVGDNFGYADPSDAKDKSDGFEEYIEYEYTTIDKEGKEKKTSGKGNDIPFTINRQSSRETGVESDSTDIKYNNKLNVYNKKKYIKLSGYAWEDMYYGKQSNRNNLYNSGELKDENGNSIADNNDKRLNEVRVTLYKEDGTKLDETTTKTITNTKGEKEDGAYIFGDYLRDTSAKKILIKDLEGAYIQFTYNGLNYETVALNCIDEEGKKVQNGNTAKEFTVTNDTEENEREKYNAKYEYVDNEGIYSKDGTCIGMEYDYDSENYSSTLHYNAGSKDGYEGAKYPIRTSYYTGEEFWKMLDITARTETNTNPKNKEDYRLLGQNRTLEEILKSGEDEITNINLGLYEREQPDLAIAQDVYNVNLEINGYSHTYEYANRFSDEYLNQNDIFNVGVKFGTKYGSESYTRTVYESDCKYTGDNKLKAYVTYRIAINNQATTLNSRVNSLLEYYDKKYYDNPKAYLNGIELHCEPISYDSNEYAKVRIDTYDESRKVDLRIGTTGGDTEYVDVKFEIKDIGAIFFDESGSKLEDEIVLKTYAEINSYSTFYDKDYGKEENEDKNYAGKIYAGIDKDSNPGNIEEGKKEDDSDWAPSLIITADEARTISGTVFLDESVLDKVTSNPNTYTRNGNGVYEENTENTISGVKVELYETKKDKDGNIIYDEDSNIVIADSPSGITKYKNGQNGGTGKDGYFEISGFIPGDYVIVYTWGDKTYIEGDPNNPINVNDYKGTIYNESSRATYEDWYRDYPEEQKWRKSRYSDATDDYGTRKIIDSYENNTNISMNSMTPNMKFGIEYKDDIKSYTGTSMHLLNNENKIEPEDSKLIFNIPYVDFGITERARQVLEISKNVKTVKITLANGQTIVDAQVEEKLDRDGNPERDENGNIIYKLVGETVKGVTYMGPSKNNTPKNGYLKSEIDSELIQGSTIEIGYEIIVKNNSEVDYDSLNYYKYGFKEGSIITITPTRVYDYLDNSMVIDKENEENSEWTMTEQRDYEDEYQTEKTIIENYLSYASTTIEDDKIIDITGYTSSYEEYYQEITEWSSVNVKIARQKRLADKTILNNVGLEDELAPGKYNTASLYATKVLANNDEIDLNNDVEVTQIERTSQTGRKVTPVSSILYDKGETVTVTPSTGENRDYTSIVILAISSFIILGTGIIFIKKKILG